MPGCTSDMSTERDILTSYGLEVECSSGPRRSRCDAKAIAWQSYVCAAIARLRYRDEVSSVVQ